MVKLLIVLTTLLLTTIASADSLTIDMLGLTMHGPGAETNAAADMPRKLDKGGKFVWHPEFNITYAKNNNFLNVTGLKDCFDHNAYFVGAGRRKALTNNLSLQYSLGIYARQKPAKISVPFGLKAKGIDYIPTPWIGLNYDIPVSESFSLNMQINTNVILTHTSVGLTYNF